MASFSAFSLEREMSFILVLGEWSLHHAKMLYCNISKLQYDEKIRKKWFDAYPHFRPSRMIYACQHVVPLD